MEFSVIVPTYNRPELLKECVSSLLGQDFKGSYEIIIIDDGSDKKPVFTDKRIRVIRQENKGCAAARNLGLKHAKGKNIAFTDDDCIVGKGWLTQLSKRLQTHQIVGGSIVNPTGKYIAWAQYILNFSAWYPSGQKKIVNDIPTANIAYRRNIMNINFDDDLGRFGYSDSYYNHKLDRKILFDPDIQVTHNTWESQYGLKKFFAIQKRAGQGFAYKGYRVHGTAGKILSQAPLLNLFCPRLLMVAGRSLKSRYALHFTITLPLLVAGEFYRGWSILRFKP